MDNGVVMNRSLLKSIDWNLALSLANNREDLAREMLIMLAKGLPEEKVQFNQLFNENDFNGLKNAVHRLHGATCYCGAPKLKQAAYLLESALTNSKKDYSQVKSLLDNLNTEIDNLLDESKAIGLLN